jgi:hypothetical protein
MAMKVSRADVWVAAMKDRPGTLAEKLQALAKAGANLAFVIGRRAPEKPGASVVFVTPIAGRKQFAAARKAGFRKTKSLHSIRVEAPDRRGLGAKMTAALAAAGINLRGLSAATIGKRCAVYLAFDTAANAAKAAGVMKRM